MFLKALRDNCGIGLSADLLHMRYVFGNDGKFISPAQMKNMSKTANISRMAV